jgi:ornithine cyclodeaminase/alanine dehydrogenase-like protein (mu-crystallin family)
MRDAIGAMRDAHRELGEGRALVPLKMHLDYPPGSGYTHWARILPAILPGMDACAARIFTSSTDWKGPPPKETTVIVLWRFADMGMQALISSGWLVYVRTAAPTGLATDLQARPDAHVVAVVGTGPHARAQLRAIVCVRPIDEVRVFSPNQAHRDAYAAEMSAELGIPVRAVASNEEAVRGADIVTAATKRPKDVAIRGEWIAPGTHVNSIGSWNEIDDVLVGKSRLMVSDHDQVLRATPPRQPYTAMLGDGRMREEDIASLSDVVVGRKPARCSEEEITVFASSAPSLWDTAVAARVYALAKERGVGTDVPLV